jgi:tripartite ATP-independent transporter DctM subunit
MTIAIFTFSLLGAMAIGMPIAYALLICGVALMLSLDIFDSQIVAQNVINGADSFPLMAVPFFMLAGELMNKGGLASRIVNVAIALVGHLRGGLGYVAILASCILSSLSGSAAADAAALAALVVPMMVAAGHSKRHSAGLVAASGVIGPVIPPSIGFVLFGVVGNVSISKLFLAGIVPGLMIGLGLCVAWWWIVRNEEAGEFGQPPRQSLAQILKAMVDGFWALMLPVIIIVGLRFGVFTPTEAAAVVAVYSFFVATCIYRELKLADLYDVIASAAITTGVVMFLVAAALVSSWLITVAEISAQVVDLLKPFMSSQTALLLAIMVLVVIVGTALDMTPTILILTPVLMPIVREAGIDPVYFGVLFIINNSIGLVTPPVGVVLNVVCGVSKISMEEIIKGVTPFMIAQLVVLLLLVLFPILVIGPARFLAG